MGRRTARAESSLWIGRHPRDLVVRLDRWASYPYFLETLRSYGALPETVRVTWCPFADFVKYGFDSDDPADDWDFVDDVAGRMQRGDDIPPLVRSTGGHKHDGQHRAFAADKLGIRRAPTITLDLGVGMNRRSE